MQANEMSVILCATSDPNYDRRMLRISGSLAKVFAHVRLIGRQTPRSVQLVERSFEQERLNGLFAKGVLMYAEFNLRPFFRLLFARFDMVCAVDLDTLPACWMAAKLKGKALVFDAHEYFSEVPELHNRAKVKRIWEWIVKAFIP